MQCSMWSVGKLKVSVKFFESSEDLGFNYRAVFELEMVKAGESVRSVPMRA